MYEPKLCPMSTVRCGGGPWRVRSCSATCHVCTSCLDVNYGRTTTRQTGRFTRHMCAACYLSLGVGGDVAEGGRGVFKQLVRHVHVAVHVYDSKLSDCGLYTEPIQSQPPVLLTG